MLGFETLTLAPIDRSLIEPSLLDEDDIAWLTPITPGSAKP
jgi:Xaa-Pro aminopeptidase